jgi:hypothetical protein
MSANVIRSFVTSVTRVDMKFGDLASALRRAEAALGDHEKRNGAADRNWPDRYAAYMLAEQAGMELPK